MRAWLDRYDDVRPTVKEGLRDLGMRAGLPLLGLLALNRAIGFAITLVWGGWRFEDAVNAALQAGRTPLLDEATRIASTIGNAPSNIGACLVFMALVYWRTRRWWVALIPGLALSIEAIVHAVTSTLVNRDRPAVDHLDVAQPTASFPSGHTGATLAQVLILLFLAHRLSSAAARWALGILTLGFIGVLGYSRLYLGMHHVSDVVVGVMNGLVAATVAWNYLRVPSPSRTG